MKGFNIKVERKEEDGITLRFYSEVSTKLNIKDIKYFCSSTEKYLPQTGGFLNIVLDNNFKLEFFKFPNENKKYSYITFLIDEKGKNNNLISVSVNLKTNDIQIKETDFKT